MIISLLALILATASILPATRALPGQIVDTTYSNPSGEILSGLPENYTEPKSSRRSQYIYGEAEWTVGYGKHGKWSYVAFELDHYPGDKDGDKTYCWAGGDEVAAVRSCRCKTTNDWRHHVTQCTAEFILDQEHLAFPRPVPEILRIRFQAGYWETAAYRRLWLPFRPQHYIRRIDCRGARKVCKKVRVRNHKRRVSRYNRNFWWRHFPATCRPDREYQC